MLVPLSWLHDFTPLDTDPTDDVAVRALAEVLNGLGLVVEGIEPAAGGPDGVVLARVLEIAPIEGLDRVRRVLVDAGRAAPVEIGCGAWNFAVGDVVPLATVGAVLPGGRVIARRSLRHVVSDGMLCSPAEVGLDDDAEGLLVLASTGRPDAPLPPGMTPGQPLGDYLGLEPDVVYDLAIEANRPDCLSIAGIARDLAAKLGLPFEVPSPRLEESGPPAAELAAARIDAPQLCRRLTGRVLTGVSVLASPVRLARRLRLAGMRPINALVDASNYVMVELGQPTHPYDLDRLAGGRITVRGARRGEELVTLDGQLRALGLATRGEGTGGELEEAVIVDGEDRPVGIAGVMGGADSEIGESTTQVLLEAAEFEARAIGRAAKRLGLRSEASIRFERGIDPLGVDRAADRVCELIVEAHRAAGAPLPVVAPGRLDACAEPYRPRRLTVRTERANALLGTELDAEAIAGYLRPIGFLAEPAGGDPLAGAEGFSGAGAEGGGAGGLLAVTVPSFRPDVTREVDVVEEVARHYGYEHIARTERRSPAIGRLSGRQAERRLLRRLAASTGAHEAWTASMVDPDEHSRLVESKLLVGVANPMAREESVLRAHLLPGLLAALRRNAARRYGSVRLFEVGHVFTAPGVGAALPAEREHLAIVLAEEGDSTVDAVHTWRLLAEGLRLAPEGYALEPLGEAAGTLALGAHPTRSAEVVVSAPTTGLGAVGVVGEVDPDVLATFGIAAERSVGWILLDLDALLVLPRRSPLARPVSPYPSSDIDLAFSLDEATPAAALERALAAAAGPCCEWVRLIDVYRGPGLSEGSRSLTYRLRFSAADRTLTDAEVGELRAGCIAAVEAALPAKLRG